MRTVHFLLVAIALMSLSSLTMARSAGTTMARVSAINPNCNSVILHPGKPCAPAACSADCSRMYKGTGTCFSRDGCDLEYCPSPLATTSTGSKI